MWSQELTIPPTCRPARWVLEAALLPWTGRCQPLPLPALPSTNTCSLVACPSPSLLQTFSKLFRHWPSAIAYPNNTEHVAAAVKCAVKYKAAVHPRCGGHGNEGAAEGGWMRAGSGFGWLE